MNQTESLQTIKRASAIGLWGSVGVVVATAFFLLVSPYRFAMQTDYTRRWMLVAGTVLAVLAVSMALLAVRRQVPVIRQTEGIAAKLGAYAQYVKSLFYSMLAVVVVVCLLAVVSSQNVLLMLAMVATLVLFLAYPNMYRMKVELGLSDEEMRSLFGDKYIGSDGQQ